MKCIYRLLIFLFILAANVLFGQQTDYRLQSDITGKFGAALTSWKAGDDNITEFAVPFSLKYPVNQNLLLYMITAPAFTNRSIDTTSYSLGGLSDIKVGGHYMMMNGKLLFTFGLNLPSGKNRLNRRELTVAKIISQANYNFTVPSFGQGFDAQAGISTGFKLDSWMLGCGASYLMKGRFQPYAEYNWEYDPGDEITLSVGLNRGNFYFDLLYSIYQNDYEDGNLKFHSGPNLVIQIMYSFKMQDYTVILFARDRIKQKSSYYTADQLPQTRLFSNRNQFDLQAVIAYQYRGYLNLRGSLYSKVYSNNDFNFGALLLFGPGFGFDYSLTDNLTLTADLKAGFGKIQTTGGVVNLNGVTVLFGLDMTL